MQQACQSVILQDSNLQKIEIFYTLPRICHLKFEEDPFKSTWSLRGEEKMTIVSKES